MSSFRSTATHATFLTSSNTILWIEHLRNSVRSVDSPLVTTASTPEKKSNYRKRLNADWDPDPNAKFQGFVVLFWGCVRTEDVSEDAEDTEGVALDAPLDTAG